MIILDIDKPERCGKCPMHNDGNDYCKLAHDHASFVRAKGCPIQTIKTGYWFIDERPESDSEVICSNCEQPIFKYHRMDFDYRPKYCPNCGARMEESGEA